jgi:hypothetical protein
MDPYYTRTHDPAPGYATPFYGIVKGNAGDFMGTFEPIGPQQGVIYSYAPLPALEGSVPSWYVHEVVRQSLRENTAGRGTQTLGRIQPTAVTRTIGTGMESDVGVGERPRKRIRPTLITRGA